MTKSLFAELGLAPKDGMGMQDFAKEPEENSMGKHQFVLDFVYFDR